MGGKTAKNVTVYAKWVKTPKTAQQKWDIKETKRFMKAENASAETLSQELMNEYGYWLDPEGRRSVFPRNTWRTA